MQTVTAAQLASALGVTRARVSQWVSEGKLKGCYRGEGRARRFNVQRAAAALQRTLDASQSLGNGAGTAETLEAITHVAIEQPQETVPGAEPPLSDVARMRRAKADQAETAAIKAKLALATESGRYVLAADLQAQVARAIAAEMAEVDAVLRQASDALAAEHGLDGREVKAVLRQHWRAHRQRRAGAARGRADQVEPTEAEAVEMQGVT